MEGALEGLRRQRRQQRQQQRAEGLGPSWALPAAGPSGSTAVGGWQGGRGTAGSIGHLEEQLQQAAAALAEIEERLQ